MNYPSCPHAVGAGYYSNDALLAAQCAKAGPDGIDPRTGLLIGVWQGRLLSIESTGLSSYDGLNVSMEKRYSDRWGMRLSYALGYSRGDTFEQYGTNGISVNGVQTQVLGDLNMDLNWQPAEHDRKHVLTLSGRTELPGGITLSPIFRYMSANPFTMYNSQLDLDRNGTNWDPIPAGTYTGTGDDAFTVEHNGRQGGARAGDYINLDVRFGWRARPAEGDTLDIYFDIINVFNRPNFFVASYANGDQNSGNFSRYTLLRSGGIPQQANFGDSVRPKIVLGFQAAPSPDLYRAGCPFGAPGSFSVRLVSPPPPRAQGLGAPPNRSRLPLRAGDRVPEAPEAGALPGRR